MTRQALGKGLGALLGSIDRESGTLRELAHSDIQPNPHQPRQTFDEAGLSELAASLIEHGMLQPVTVRPLGDGRFELIAGERRWRAAAIAGLSVIPALVRETSDLSTLEMALVENIQRADLNPMESAQAYQRLIVEFGLTQEQVARRVGKDRSTVANAVRLLNLPVAVQEMVESGALSTGHAKVLLGLASPEQDAPALARHVAAEGLSVRDLERMLASPQPLPNAPHAPAPKAARAADTPAHIADLQARLARYFGAEVTLKEGKRAGRIEIRYRSPEERARLTGLLLGE
ncbi:MAG: ParB/RepB/Spo0J family partition protein [Nitrospirota bacterium]|nr:ParB/RepB/Spo0J family partition protein [Nitrospirota bacterium]